MDAPLISAIIPVYNAEKYVADAIGSLINQTAGNWEAILVDDGSTDNSLQICKEFAAKDSRITVIYKVNGGVGSARNVGIDAADGKYMLFLDADDGLVSTAIERLSFAAEKHDADLVLFGGYENHIDHNETVICQTQIDSPIVGVYQNAPSKALFPALSDIHMVTRQLFRKDVISNNNVRFTDHKIAEDALFFIDYYGADLSCIVGIPDKLFLYSIRDNGSASQKFQKERVTDNFYMSSAIRNVAKKLNVEGDPICRFAVQKAVVADLQLGIKNICLSDLTIAQRISWLHKQMSIPEVSKAVKSVPISSCKSNNDKAKLLLLKGGFYTFTILLVSRKNGRGKRC